MSRPGGLGLRHRGELYRDGLLGEHCSDRSASGLSWTDQFDLTFMAADAATLLCMPLL